MKRFLLILAALVGLGFLIQPSLTLASLPWLILLLCPVMHLFMHHGHGQHAPERIDVHDGERETHHEPH